MRLIGVLNVSLVLQRDMKCMGVADCYSAINNDLAMEKFTCNGNVNFKTENFLNA